MLGRKTWKDDIFGMVRHYCLRHATPHAPTPHTPPPHLLHTHAPRTPTHHTPPPPPHTPTSPFLSRLSVLGWTHAYHTDSALKVVNSWRLSSSLYGGLVSRTYTRAIRWAVWTTKQRKLCGRASDSPTPTSLPIFRLRRGWVHCGRAAAGDDRRKGRETVAEG